MASDTSNVRLVEARKNGQGDLKRTFETGVNLSDATRRAMIDLLNQQLADATDLFTQTKQAHWNVKGRHFYPLHLLFDSLAEKRTGEMDEIAERATAIGGYATGTVRMAAANSQLEEIPTGIDGGMDYVKALVERYTTYANSLRDGIDKADKAGDMDTADLFTQISREVDKDLWFLQAHLQD
jgi:starvation-inducible DNA-binding protein